MVIINTDPWASDNDEPNPAPVRPESSEQSLVLGVFGFQDLANDYFHVLTQRSRPNIFKLIWGIVVLALMGFTFYMVYQLLYDYFQYNSFNQAKVEWKDTVTLPAISVCSINAINYTLLTEYMSGDTYKEGILTQFDDLLEQLENFKGGGYVLDTLDTDDFETLALYEMYNGSFARPDTFRTDISEMLLGSDYDYLFQNVEQFIEDISKNAFPNELGSCLEINDDGALVQSNNGVAGGFTIDLNAHIDDYLPSTSTVGFMVYIRDQDEVIMMDRGGLAISPGTETFLRLNKKSVTRLGEPHGTCNNVESDFNKYGTHYNTVRECIIETLVLTMFDACECMPWYAAERLYMLNKTDMLDSGYTILDCLSAANGDEDEEDACYEDDGSSKKRRSLDSLKRLNLDVIKSTSRPKRDIYDDYESTWITNETVYDTKYAPYICGFVLQKTCASFINDYLQKGELEFDNCAEPCSFNEWEVDMSTTLFPPTEKYYNKFLKSKTGNYTLEYARENLARIHIYYDDLKINVIEQEPAYEIQNFIAEFGGTVDLFIGFSFFTVFQLVEIAIAACIKRCRGKTQPKPNSPKKEKKAEFEPNESGLTPASEITMKSITAAMPWQSS